MTFDFYSYTNLGERPVNEDSVGTAVCGNKYVFALCDGLGGHGNGDMASRIAVDTMLASAKMNKGIDICFEDAKIAVEDLRRNEHKDCRTTATLLIIDNNAVSWGHVGDSRIYHFHKNKYLSHTLDHSVPQMLVSIGEIKDKDIRHHEDRNRLLRSIPWDDRGYDIDVKDQPIKSGDSFIMMSDGFWDWVDEKMMKKCLKKGKTAQQTVQLLCDLAFKYGKGNNMDNLSVIVIKVK